ncbi:MAG: EF-P 5-aminopentanol modification-associated protein YfmH [Lachnospirales bacterium]
MIEVYKLSKGANFYFVNKPGFVGKQAMVAFNYGSCDTNFKFNDKNIRQPKGIAHFLEHKMFEDKNINVFDEFSKYGAVSNAYTNFSTTAYYFNCNDNFSQNLSILLQMISDLYVNDENVNKEKGIISQEINMYEDDPYWQIYFNTLKCCYRQNSVRESVAGSIESIKEITPDMLYKSYDAFYTCDNCSIIVIGDLDLQSVGEQLERELKLKPTSNLEKTKHYENGIYTKKLSKQMAVDKTIYNIGFKENNIDENLAYRLCINNIILRLLTDRTSSLWYKLYKDGLADYDFGYDYVSGLDYGCAIIKGESNDYEKIYAEIREEIDRFISFGVSKSLINRLVSSIKSRMIMDFDNISSLSSLIADCASKNIELLDIYENYGKIDSTDIVNALKNNYTDYVISVIEPM